MSDFREHMIGTYKSRMEAENKRAHKAIEDGEYEIAALAVTSAAKCKAAIDEIEFWMECEEDD